MKKLLTLTLIAASLFFFLDQVYCDQQKKFFNFNRNKTKTEKNGYVGNLYSVAKFFSTYEYAANNYDKNIFLNSYDKSYISSDGFNLDILSKVLNETWHSYPGIKYQVKLNSVTFYENMAIADVTETAIGYAKTENENVGEFVSTMQSIYYLRPNGKSWIIDNDYTIKENIILSWGDAKNAKIKLSVPNQIQAGKEYTATLNIKKPDGVIAIGSITADKVTYPQKPSKEIFRKFSSEGTLERIMKANTDNTNEYVVATVGFTRPKIDDEQNLNIKLTGYSCIMERINVIPVNKFIEVKNAGKTK